MKQPQEYKVVSLRECPTPESLLVCETPEQVAEYWRLNVATNPYYIRGVLRPATIAGHTARSPGLLPGTEHRPQRGSPGGIHRLHRRDAGKQLAVGVSEPDGGGLGRASVRAVALQSAAHGQGDGRAAAPQVRGQLEQTRNLERRKK